MFNPTIMECPECGQLIFGQSISSGIIYVCPTCGWSGTPDFLGERGSYDIPRSTLNEQNDLKQYYEAAAFKEPEDDACS